VFTIVSFRLHAEKFSAFVASLQLAHTCLVMNRGWGQAALATGLTASNSTRILKTSRRLTILYSWIWPGLNSLKRSCGFSVLKFSVDFLATLSRIFLSQLRVWVLISDSSAHEESTIIIYLRRSLSLFRNPPFWPQKGPRYRSCHLRSQKSLRPLEKSQFCAQGPFRILEMAHLVIFKG
jgi:hypothetical protein